MQAAAHGDQGIFLTSGFLGAREPVAIAFLVLELEAVHRLDIGQYFLAAGFIQKNRQATTGADAHVMIALRTDVVISLYVRAIEYRVTLDAFLPEAFRYAGTLAALFLAYPCRQNLVNPAHGIPHPAKAPL